MIFCVILNAEKIDFPYILLSYTYLVSKCNLGQKRNNIIETLEIETSL